MRICIVTFFLISLVACSNEGKPLPTFTLNTLEGKTITNQNLMGKIIVINVWATWCGNCINELDELNNLVKSYQNDTSVVFLALSDENSQRVNDFLKKRNFSFTHIPNAIVLTDNLQTQLVKTYPQHIILDKNLNITFEATGELNGAQAILSEEINKLK